MARAAEIESPPMLSAESAQPASAIAVESSFLKISSTRSTPACPPTASPQRIGRPTSTAVAPRPSALSTSVPQRKPPVDEHRAPPGDGGDYAGQRVEIDAGAPSSCRAPWLETTTPAAP